MRFSNDSYDFIVVNQIVYHIKFSVGHTKIGDNRDKGVIFKKSLAVWIILFLNKCWMTHDFNTTSFRRG